MHGLPDCQHIKIDRLHGSEALIESQGANPDEQAPVGDVGLRATGRLLNYWRAYGDFE